MKKFKFLLPVALLVLIACNNEKEVNHENHQKAEMKDEQNNCGNLWNYLHSKFMV